MRTCEGLCPVLKHIHVYIQSLKSIDVHTIRVSFDVCVCVRPGLYPVRVSSKGGGELPPQRDPANHPPPRYNFFNFITIFFVDSLPVYMKCEPLSRVYM